MTTCARSRSDSPRGWHFAYAVHKTDTGLGCLTSPWISGRPTRQRSQAKSVPRCADPVLCTSRSRPDDVAYGYACPSSRWPSASDAMSTLSIGCLPRCTTALSRGSGSGLGDSLVLFPAPAADADGTYYLAGAL